MRQRRRRKIRRPMVDSRVKGPLFVSSIGHCGGQVHQNGEWCVFFFTMALRHPARSLTISMPQVLEAYGTQNLKAVIPQMEIIRTILRLDGMDKR